MRNGFHAALIHSLKRIPILFTLQFHCLPAYSAKPFPETRRPPAASITKMNAFILGSAAKKSGTLISPDPKSSTPTGQNRVKRAGHFCVLIKILDGAQKVEASARALIFVYFLEQVFLWSFVLTCLQLQLVSRHRRRVRTRRGGEKYGVSESSFVIAIRNRRRFCIFCIKLN